MSVPAGEPRDPRRFALLRCSGCRGAVTAGEPPGAEAYEQGVYAPGPPRAARIVHALQGLTAGQPARALRRAGLPRRGRVLDAGAGTGAMARRILALQPDVKIGCGAARVTVRRPPSALSRATASSVVTVSCRRSTRARAAGSSGGAQPRSSIVSSWMRRAAIQARCEG